MQMSAPTALSGLCNWRDEAGVPLPTGPPVLLPPAGSPLSRVHVANSGCGEYKLECVCVCACVRACVCVCVLVYCMCTNAPVNNNSIVELTCTVCVIV